jgi:TonB family protein
MSLRILVLAAIVGFFPSASAAQSTQGDVSRPSETNGPLQAATTPLTGTQTDMSFAGIEVLTDMQGIDFMPYLARVRRDVRYNWYAVIPEGAAMKKGTLAIEFAIRKNGRIAGMKLVSSSGDIALDRAAWGGVIASEPFPVLPLEFKGEYLALRLRFYYNPTSSELAKAGNLPPSAAIQPNSIPLPESTNTPLNAPGPSSLFVPAVLRAYESESMAPKYPKKAREAKVEGVVRLDAEIDRKGKVAEIKIIEGPPVLAEASVHAVRNWRFYPAQRDGNLVGDHAMIRVDFQLNEKKVLARVEADALPVPVK